MAEHQTKGLHHRVLWTLVTAAVGLALVRFFPTLDLGWTLLNLAWFDVCLVANIVPHEFAHAFAARALGLRIFRVLLGSGPTWWRGIIFGFDVEARRYPFDGVVLAAHRDLRGIRWKQFLVILAGPAANLLLLAIPLAIYGWDGWLVSPLSGRSAGWTMFVFASLTTLLINLWPHRIQTSLGPLPSDGSRLLDGLLGRDAKTAEQNHAGWYILEAFTCAEQKHPTEAMGWLERGLAVYPENALLLRQKATLSINIGQLEVARSLLMALLARTADKDDTRFGLMNDIAYVDALLDTDEFLEEADRYSADALTIFSWDPSLQNTRGVVLLALGRVDEALPLLRTSADVARENGDHIAQCHGTLAMAEARHGNLAAAEKALDVARQAAPNCFLIPRAEAAIQVARGASHLLA